MDNPPPALERIKNQRDDLIGAFIALGREMEVKRGENAEDDTVIFTAETWDRAAKVYREIVNSGLA